jgi:hypothetical protein
MSDSLVFEAELEGLLREIAADPGSRLLRLPRPARPRDLLAMPEPAGRARAGLSTAERQLLEVHRDELAHLLRRACLMRFFSDPVRSIYVNRSKTANESIQVDTPEEWQARARQALEDARSSPAPLSGIELVEACLRSDRGASISITELARASQVLQVSNVAAAYVGLDMALNGLHSEALTFMQAVLARSHGTLIRSCVLENMALAESALGKFSSAQDLYRQAAELDISRVSPVIGWLLLSLQACDRAGTLEASHRLDCESNDARSVTMHLAGLYRDQRVRGSLAVSRHSVDMAKSVVGAVGPLSREVVCVLLN